MTESIQESNNQDIQVQNQAGQIRDTTQSILLEILKVCNSHRVALKGHEEKYDERYASTHAMQVEYFKEGREVMNIIRKLDQKMDGLGSFADSIKISLSTIASAVQVLPEIRNDLIKPATGIDRLPADVVDKLDKTYAVQLEKIDKSYTRQIRTILWSAGILVTALVFVLVGQKQGWIPVPTPIHQEGSR